MKRKTRRQKNEENKRRLDAVKNLMSTFSMSTVAVVAVVTLIPASPKAEITKSVSLSDEVAYQVVVTDEEDALDLDSLVVVLENQLEYYEQPISLGENSGYFAMLNTNTEYQLSVYGNKGFGLERLDSVTVRTRPKIGGVIKDVVGDENFVQNYSVYLSIYDPDNKYTSFTLYYGYNHHPGEPLVYSSLVVSNTDTLIELVDVFTEDEFHIYLEGTTTDGTKVLDEIWVTPPFSLYASVYKNSVQDEQVVFNAYGDYKVDDLTFKMNVYKNERLVKTKELKVSGDMHLDSDFIIDGLQPDTIYFFECIAIYTNPQTLRTKEQIIYEEEITTLNEYSYTSTITEYDEYYEITVTVNDPTGYYQMVYYEVFDMTDDHHMYLSGEQYMLEEIDETKTYTFTIYKPIVDTYQINIVIRNELDFNIREEIERIVKD